MSPDMSELRKSLELKIESRTNKLMGLIGIELAFLAIVVVFK